MPLKRIATGIALRSGLVVKRKADDARVRSLLRKLRPIRISAPLIRIGAHGDGGYLLPADLDGITACFSPGVDQTASFEIDLLSRGIPSFLADASVDGPPEMAADMDFEKKFIGTWNDDLFMTMDNWMDAKLDADHGDLLLQMDIEGAEWQVLLNISDERLRSFRILVIEFHSLPHCFDQVAINLFESCLKRLEQDFWVVHAHPNNVAEYFKYGDIEIPHFLEVTFLRKDRGEATGFVTEFPHPLDAACAPDRPDTALPRIFRGGGSH